MEQHEHEGMYLAIVAAITLGTIGLLWGGLSSCWTMQDLKRITAVETRTALPAGPTPTLLV